MTASRMRSLSQMNALLNSAVAELERVVTPELGRKSYSDSKKTEESSPSEPALARKSDSVPKEESSKPAKAAVVKVNAEEQKLVDSLLVMKPADPGGIVSPRSLLGDAFEPAPTKPPPPAEAKKWGAAAGAKSSPVASPSAPRKFGAAAAAAAKVEEPKRVEKKEPESGGAVFDVRRFEASRSSSGSAGLSSMALPAVAASGPIEQMLVALEVGSEEPLHAHTARRQWAVLAGEVLLQSGRSVVPPLFLVWSLSLWFVSTRVTVRAGDVVLFPVHPVFFSFRCIKAATLLQSFLGEADFVFK